MIIKTFYKNNFTYVEGISYFELCRDDNLLILKGKYLDLTIEKIDRFILFSDKGIKLEDIRILT